MNKLNIRKYWLPRITKKAKEIRNLFGLRGKCILCYLVYDYVASKNQALGK